MQINLLKVLIVGAVKAAMDLYKIISLNHVIIVMNAAKISVMKV